MIAPVSVTELEIRGVDRRGAASTVDDWYVRSIELRETLSEPYALSLELATDDTDRYLPGLVGGRCTLRLGRDHSERTVQGVVLGADSVGVVGRRLQVRVWVGPALQLAGLSRRRRLFENATAVQIVETVLAPTLSRYGGTLDPTRLAETMLRTRDYCAQMDETDLAFVQRLLAEEGIAFGFRHGDEAEEIVLMPRSAILCSAAGQDEAEPAELVLRTKSPDLLDEETVQSLHLRARMRPRAAESSMWDWKACPPTRRHACAQALTMDVPLPDSPARWGEIYEHEPYRPVEPTEGAPLYEQVDREVELIAGRVRADDVRAAATSNVLGMTAGACFELAEHPVRDLDGRYAVLSAWHHLDCGEADDAKAVGHAGSYRNRLSCMRVATSDGTPTHGYAPERRAKPTAPGPVTATVVGPEGETIHTDAHGRIKVRLHWERERTAAEQLPCAWVRVAQTWAGPGYGSVFIPRIGMEVVIAFVEGDPDRPVCTGVVYNGANTPPYGLPDHKTRSVIRTASDDGEGGHNELSFEDASGHEQVFLRAQRNLVEQVRADHRTTVGGDQTISVEKNRTTEVQGDAHLEVKGARKVGIADGRVTSVCVGGWGEDTLDVEGLRQTLVRGEWGVRVDPPRAIGLADPAPGEVVSGPPIFPPAKSVRDTKEGTLIRTTHEGMTVTALEKIELVVRDGASLVITQDSITLRADKILLERTPVASMPPGMRSTAAIALTETGIVAEGVDVYLQQRPTEGAVQSELELSEGKALVRAVEGIKVECDHGAQVQLDACATIEGATVELRGPGDVAKLTVAPTGVSSEGPTITSSATGPMVLTGQPIKLN